MTTNYLKKWKFKNLKEEFWDYLPKTALGAVSELAKINPYKIEDC